MLLGVMERMETVVMVIAALIRMMLMKGRNAEEEEKQIQQAMRDVTRELA